MHADRSTELIVALLGILEAGAAYTPVEPSWPQRRKELIVEQAGAVVVLAAPGLERHSLSPGVPIVPIHSVDSGAKPSTPLASPSLAHPDSPAYVLFTSGSSGTPKGVVISHRGICNRQSGLQSGTAVRVWTGLRDGVRRHTFAPTPKVEALHETYLGMLGDNAMRVLYVSHCSALGGAERSLLALMEALRPHGVEPLLACPPVGELPARAEASNIPVVTVPVHRLRRPRRVHEVVEPIPSLVRAWARLAFVIRRSGVQLVHTNSTVAQIWGGPPATVASIPTIWHWRDFYDVAPVARAMSVMADALVTVSRPIQRFAREQVGERVRIELVENGVADFDLKEDLETTRRWRRRAGLTHGGVLVVMIGQSVPRKGHEPLVRAIANVSRQCDGIRALVACATLDGVTQEHANSIRELVRALGCQHRIRVLNRVDDVPGLMRAADIVAVPSLREPFGRTAVEGMLASKPVVASDVDGLADIVRGGETGLLVPPGDVEALAGALLHLANLPGQRKRMGETGRRVALERYTIERTAAAMAAVYRQALERRAIQRRGR